MIQNLLSTLHKLNIKLWTENDKLHYECGSGGMPETLLEEIRRNKSQLIVLLNEDSAYEVSSRTEGGDEEFPLTPMQQAYWIGEKNFFSLSGAAFYYQEYHVESLDIPRLELCLNKIISINEMMRVRILPSGHQVVVKDEEVPFYQISVNNLTIKMDDEAGASLEVIRNNIISNPGDVEKWPLFKLRVSTTHSGDVVHLLGRFILGDALSWDMFFRQLLIAYYENKLPARPSAVYRDYVASLNEHKHTHLYKSSVSYWRSIDRSILSPPNIPIYQHLLTTTSSFTRKRRSLFLAQKQWGEFIRISRENNLSPNALLCALFCITLKVWANSEQFSINMMYSRRANGNHEFPDLFGNCTSTIPLVINLTGNQTVESNALAIQETIMKSIENSALSGVEITRLLTRDGNDGDITPIPIVFASTLGLSDPNITQQLMSKHNWRYGYGYIQTPQIWLDCQVYDSDFGVRINWDCVEEIFPEGVLDAMFGAFKKLIESKSSILTLPLMKLELLPNTQIQARKKVNETGKPYPIGTLHGLFAQCYAAYTDAIAVVCGEEKITYGELYSRAQVVTKTLVINGIKPRDVVAIHINKSINQVIAVFGTLFSGAAYLPLDASHPYDRKKYILSKSGVKAVLVENEIGVAEMRESGVKVLDVTFLRELSALEAMEDLLLGEPEDLAYIIFTSGSTGLPKGVMIPHRAAVNTIIDINERINIDRGDAILGLSALNFDLSVYDIFGTLSCGAKLVLPPQDQQREPREWLSLMERERITVWNSVPAFMEMLLAYIGDSRARSKSELRIVMLSGDWIPTTLPAAMYGLYQNTRLIALGGATEASIWSNYFEVRKNVEFIRSIPYGYPLHNQSMYVLDEYLCDCPDWVVGDLYIGGNGVYDGYVGDAELTSKSIVILRDGTHVYKTGDLARYIGKGLIEFIGRKDFQIKIRGHRIELGEIDHRLKSIVGVEDAIADVYDADKQRAIVAFIKREHPMRLDDSTVRSFLTQSLPYYMIPDLIQFVEEFPLSVNGKVDRKALKRQISTTAKDKQRCLPRTEQEERLFEIWRGILGTKDFSIDDSFLELGGDSVAAVRVANAIEKEFGQPIQLTDLMSHRTIRSMASLISEPQDAARTKKNVVKLTDSASRNLFFAHPIGGNSFCYDGLSKTLEDTFNMYVFNQTMDLVNNGDGSLSYLGSQYAEQIRGIQSHGPYYLGGWSLGALISLEIADYLTNKYGERSQIVMIDPLVYPANMKNPPVENAIRSAFLRDIVGLNSVGVEMEESFLAGAQDAQNIRVSTNGEQSNSKEESPRFVELYTVFRYNVGALFNIQVRTVKNPVLLISAVGQEDKKLEELVPILSSQSVWAGRFTSIITHEISADHYSILESDNRNIIKTILKDNILKEERLLT